MRNPIWHKMGVWNLKAFFSISLGIHLLFVSAAFVLFPDFKIVRLPDRTIEVSLLPLVAEEKPPPAIIPPKIKPEIRKEEIKPPDIPKREELPLQKDVEPELPPPVQIAEKKMPVEESKPLPKKEEPKAPPQSEEPKPPPMREEPKPFLRKSPEEKVAKESVAAEGPKPLAQKEESKPLPRKEESKPLPQKEEPKPIPQKEESKPLPQKEESKPIPQKEESKPLPRKEEPKPIPRKEEPKPLAQKEESKPLPRKEEPKLLSQKSQEEKTLKESVAAPVVTAAVPLETSSPIKKEENPIPLKLAPSKGDNLSLALPSSPSQPAVTVALPPETSPSVKREENHPPLKLAFSKGDNLSLPLPPSPTKEVKGGLSPSPDNGSQEGQQKGEKSVHQEASSEGSMNVARLAPPSDGKIISARPKYDKNPKPFYPPEAIKKGYEGEVLLRVEVLSNGRVGKVEVNRSSGHEILDRSALAAIKQWEFIPAKKGETAVSEWVRIPIPFRLKTNKTIVVIDGRSR